MSYDVSLVNPTTGIVLPAGETFQEGGTYAVGGTDRCELNITSNYREVFGDLVVDLDHLVARLTIPRLEKFVQEWAHATPYERDYWAPTPGNAKKAIERLLTFAYVHPTGLWKVSY